MIRRLKRAAKRNLRRRYASRFVCRCSFCRPERPYPMYLTAPALGGVWILNRAQHAALLGVGV